MGDRAELDAAEVAFIDAHRVAHFATSDAAGNPHVIPVCFAFDTHRFYLPLDDKPKRVQDQGLRRVRNIEARPQAALLIDHYADDWTQLGYVLIHGLATLVYRGEPFHDRAMVLFRERYTQYQHMNLTQRAVIAFTATRIVTWGAVRDLA